MSDNLTEFEKTLDFQEILNKIARKGDGSFHKKMEHKYSPTELSGCVRNSYFSRLYPEEFDDRTMRVFLLGNVLHELVQDNVKDVIGDKLDHIENEKAFHYLLPLDKTNGKQILISGRLDTIFYLKGDEKPIIVDYKTTANSYYNKINGPKKEHIDQINYYLACTLADHGMVVYIDKRNLEVVQHTVKFSQETFDEMVNFAIQLDTALETETVPPVDYPLMDERGNCKYCRHKVKCKEAGRDK